MNEKYTVSFYFKFTPYWITCNFNRLEIFIE